MTGTLMSDNLPLRQKKLLIRIFWKQLYIGEINLRVLLTSWRVGIPNEDEKSLGG